ncbi:MAG TPA: DEAD/DEAH box helicase [Bacilli bacterium]|nr:DEAD/DEAH box helicase [Acholeplasmataceae bacterium]HNZ77130.1 DEAD/DEAH box helicase [Bacilli bacterium]HOD60817.1 DEAD/DEAH box helicase [Bacilli bacterium]HOH61948.1 DEAD/DEAH box helicase [Bacilli bacterium]HOR18119.1 DEAD/DEAH box helicase [Bacilli bacterium]
MKKFEELKINPLLIKGIEKMKFEVMTEIQEKVIPIALKMVDIIAQAPTGTGKTIAYALPILNKIDVSIEAIQTIVIAPTRELAVQITKEINTVAFYLKDVKAVAIYGGESIDRQILALKKRPQIIVATPGRLMDHMERRTVRLDNVTTVVLDEADEMLNMGFKEDIDFILTNVKLKHQTMMFSATISKEIERIANQFLDKPVSIRIAASQLTVSTISQKMIEVKEKDKIEIIARLIDINDYKLVMIFCNTKKTVDEVTSQLLIRGFMTEALHGDMKQMQRDRVMNRFRSGLINILVASDVAARGLDIDDVDVVINYDVPTDEEYYVHRIGRTGRAQKSGLSITLVTRMEKNRLKAIANYSKAVITPMNIPSLEKVIDVRMKRILNKALEVAKEPNEYQKILTKNLNDLEVAGVFKDDLLRGLIFLHMKTNESNVEIEEIKEEISTRQKQRDQKVSRIFISIGRRDKIKVYDLTDWLVKHTNMTNADINAIEIHDNFSFFEVPTEHVDELLTTVNGSIFKGRHVILEVAKEKRQSSSIGKTIKKTNVGEKKSYHHEIQKRKTRKPFEYNKKVENKKKKY